MNILMVGHSRAGKTSFMAGMYRHLCDNKEGYGIRAKQEKQRTLLQRMAKQLSNGSYPAGTDVQQMYNFELTVFGEDVIPFNWMDYRGGILLSEDPDDEDMDKFMKAIKSADALVVFLDGEKMSDNSGKWNLEYDILLSCIMNTLEVDHKSWFPICFVITKCDLVPAGATFYGLRKFQPLFNEITNSEKVGAMLVRCSITKEDYFTPFLALSYCICGGANIYIQKRIEAMKAAQNRYRRHKPETLVGWVAAGIESTVRSVVTIIDDDLSWETELDKVELAERDYKIEQARLEQLNHISQELSEKVKKWSEDEIVFLF